MFQVFSWYVVLSTKEKAASHNRQKVAEMRKSGTKWNVMSGNSRNFYQWTHEKCVAN